MKIKPTPNYALNCDICIQGQMSNDKNKTSDCKATKSLTPVHSDLAGPIQPLAKDGCKYLIFMIILALQCYIFIKTEVRHFAHYNKISYNHLKYLWIDNRTVTCT